MSHTLCLQFQDVFSMHFFVLTCLESSTTQGGCEPMVHNIMCALDFHPNWVVLQVDAINMFNFVFINVLFQKL